MEPFRKFLQGKGFALVLAACLLAAAAAGVWAVRIVRDELQKELSPLRDSQSVAPGIDEGFERTTPDEEDSTWHQPTEPAARSQPNVPKTSASSGSAGGASGASSGSGTVREPSALQTESAPASSSAAAASAPPFSGRILNAYSGDELVYNKTLGDWRTHNGVDYAAKAGAEVTSPVAGKVTLAGTEGSWGPVVALEDSAGRVWRLCGVADPQVEPGQRVSAGDVLGTVGIVGCECAEESHIHLEVKQGETYLDPAKALT